MYPPGQFLISVSVPAAGPLRTVAPELAGRVAAFIGKAHDSAAVSAALESVAAQVAPSGGDDDIEFEFRRVDGELLIRARCGGRTSEVVCPLAA